MSVNENDLFHLGDEVGHTVLERLKSRPVVIVIMVFLVSWFMIAE